MALVRAKDDLAEILKAGPVRLRGILDQCMGYFGAFRAGEMQELVNLVTSNVAQNTAIAVPSAG